ncbi:MAG: glycosyltransferase family 1 protein [Anaerolineaceae bacterium]|nr:glycosyltransferase family 1 protein [Anaerolineaceae bacterium]
MHLTLFAIGSRGDVQPVLALGKGLQAAGYEVTLATHGIFEAFVTQHGLSFFPVEGNPLELLSQESSQEWIETGRNPMAMLVKMRELGTPMFQRLTNDYLEAVRHTDAIITSGIALYASLSVIEKTGLPAMGAYVQPLHPTRYIANAMSTPPPDWLPFKGLYNRLSHDILLEMNWRIFKGPVNEIRRTLLDLPPMTESFRRSIRQPVPCIYGFSPHVIPQPPDWDDHLTVTGYWFLDEPDWTPPDDLRAFLEAGEPPVYIGFGSMASRRAEETTHIALEALKQSGQRGLLASGWGGITQRDLPDEVFLIDAAPHSWLFPRMAAVVHHGGAGTTGAGLRAGVPSILVPHFGDQNFWGATVSNLEVGTEPIPRKRLTAGKLGAAIRRAVTDVGMRQRAAILGERIRQEDGVAAAARAVERVFGR